MKLTNRELGMALVLLNAGISRLLDQLPQRLQELVAIVMIGLGVGLLAGLAYPDVRGWVLQAWEHATNLTAGAVATIGFIAWLIYMKLRGRERQAHQAVMLTLFFVAIASALRRNAAA